MTRDGSKYEEKKRHFSQRHPRRRRTAVTARDYRRFRPKHLHAHQREKIYIKKKQKEKAKNIKKKETGE